MKGTKENAECSNRGVCDYEAGQCQCISGFSSSAGNVTVGVRRDCGRRGPFGLTLNPYYGLQQREALRGEGALVTSGTKPTRTRPPGFMGVFYCFRH